MGRKRVGRTPTGTLSAAIYWAERLGYPPCSDFYNLPDTFREVISDRKHGHIAMFNQAWEILEDARKRGVTILDQRKYYDGILRKLLADRRNATTKRAPDLSWAQLKAHREARAALREAEFIDGGEAEQESG